MNKLEDLADFHVLSPFTAHLKKMISMQTCDSHTYAIVSQENWRRGGAFVAYRYAYDIPLVTLILYGSSSIFFLAKIPFFFGFFKFICLLLLLFLI